MQPARRLALAGRLPQTPTMPREIPLQRRACLFRGRARWRDLRGRARSVRAPPPPAPPRPHATARALRPSVTCNLERLVCRLHRCAVTSVCRLRQMVCHLHPPPHTAQRTTLRPTGARLSPCRTKNSQHNTQQVLVFSPLIQRTGNKKKKVERAAFPLSLRSITFCRSCLRSSRLFVLRA